MGLEYFNSRIKIFYHDLYVNQKSVIQLTTCFPYIFRLIFKHF